jgi:TPR repeat protein
MDNQDYGLIGKLYHQTFPGQSFQKLRDKTNGYIEYEPLHYFQERWLGFTSGMSRPTDWSHLRDDDALTPKNIKIVNKHIADPDFEKDVQTDLDILIKLPKCSFSKDKILDKLVSNLENTNEYKTKINSKNPKTHVYDSKAKERLIYHISNDRELFKLSHFIKWYIYFALNNSIPDDFSVNERTKRDLEEYSDSVIRKFGMTSKFAIREIVKLANRVPPNTVALYEYGDLFYYGNAEGIDHDINKAFETYKRAACIDSEIATDANPMALWSLAYIYLNYHTSRMNIPLAVDEKIDEIEKLSYLDRIKIAYVRASQAYSISKLPAAANVIGQVARFTDEDPGCEGIDAFKKEKHLRECTYYFSLAADNGYVYANNNLAAEEMKQIIKEKDNPQLQRLHIRRYEALLKKSVTLGDAWAANKLGCFYLEGIKIEIPNQENPLTIVTTINPENAYFYFREAFKSYHEGFYDVYCAWACAHLYKSYINRLNKEELDDMFEILNKYSNEVKIMEEAFGQKEMPSREEFMERWRKAL